MSDPIHIDGYRGIWFELGQKSEYGDKYSGGLGTYTSNHVPMAVYAPAVDKTFFVYGGTPAADKRQLLAMVSCYDHRTGTVPRPVVVLDKTPVDDPHDDPSINIDEHGHLWVLVSGRGRTRPGSIFRSREPYNIEGLDLIAEQEFTYPQLYIEDGRFLLLCTQYKPGRKPHWERELYWKTSPDGRTWSDVRKLAGFGGHYQTSWCANGKIATFFNYHPEGDVDRRTNLYYAQSTDFGTTWTTADGRPLQLPLSEIDNAALVFDLAARGELMYTCDLNFDSQGRPVLLYRTSHHHQPGPQGDPREWRVTRWTGDAWETSVITRSTHNYDMGSLYIEQGVWRVIAPIAVGPQHWGTGGEMALWESRDGGRTWEEKRRITTNSPRNHSYARRPLRAADPFYAFWADGDPDAFSPSHLHFCDSRGVAHTLPYVMGKGTAVVE